jgi:hypothetical protein
MRQGGTQVLKKKIIKERLNSRGHERMTPDLLSQQDPDGEVAQWIKEIGRMAEGQGRAGTAGDG